MSSAAESSQPPGQFYCPSCERTYANGEHCPNDGTRLVRLKVSDPMIGRTFAGRYSVGPKLGQGGMGAVYRGTDSVLGRDVAIKLVTPNLVSDTDVIKRFLREAKLASKLSHPNAVAVLDFGQTEDGMFYLVMELVTGKTLDEIIKAERTLKPERIVRIGAQVCDALEGAHALQVVHRDLKPANVMLLDRGRDLVKVLDFGLAKSLAPDQTSTTMTNAGSLLGTPAFMPPELALGEQCDGRADLYSLGCILYLLGCGRLPFVSESAHELIAMHGTQAAPPMTGVPPALAAVIDRMLQKDPAMRFQSAAENRQALEDAMDHRIQTPTAGIARITLDASSPSLAAATPVPNQYQRGQTALDRLVNQDTILGDSRPPVVAAPSMPHMPRASRSKLPIIIAAVLVLGGVVTIAAVKSTKTKPTSSQVTTPEAKTPDDKLPEVIKNPAVKTPEVKTPEVVQTPEVKAPEVKTPEVVKAPEIGVGTGSAAAVTVKKTTPKTTKTTTKQTTQKTQKTGTTGTQTKKGTGSGAALPF